MKTTQRSVDQSILSETEIHDLLSARDECRWARDFQRAYMISDELQRCGVFIDVRAKEWRADGKSFLGEAIRAIQDRLDVGLVAVGNRRAQFAINHEVRQVGT